MKKYFILTSILALAACGGGSGGGGGSSNTPARNVVVPATLHGGAIAPEDITSNQAVTQMNSEVIVSSNSSLPLSRSASVTSGGVTFTSYRLDDVIFYAADAAHTADGYLQLGINDDGRIDRMFMVVGNVGANADAAVARDGENSTFEAPIFEFVRDRYAEVADSEFSASTSNPAPAMLDAIAHGRDFVGSGEGSGWEMVGDVWKFDTDGNDHYATWNPGGGAPEDFAVNNAVTPLQNAVKEENHFDEGIWVTVNNTYKYKEYGDNAVFRTVGTNATDMDSLNEMSSTLGVGHWNRTQEILPVVTYGGDIDGAGTKLQYADFGHFNPVYRTKDVDLTSGSEATSWSNAGESKSNSQSKIDTLLAKEDFQLFAGGYAIHGTTMDNDRPSLDPVSGQTYKGMAVGRVYASVECKGCSFADKKAAAAAYGVVFDSEISENDFNNQEIGRDMAKEFKTYDATMEITTEGGKIAETLKMPFYTSPVTATPQYYDVEIKQVDGVMDHVTFDAADENDIASQYRLHGADSSWNYAEARFNPGYYGVNTPSEAAGTAAIRARQENAKGYGEKRDYEVQAAWGMKLQEP